MTDGQDPLQSAYDGKPYQDQRFPSLDLRRLLGLRQVLGLGMCPPNEDDSGIRVLDLGCASGLHIREQALVYPGAHFQGVDFSHAEISVGQEQVEKQGLRNCELIQHDLRTWSVGDAPYDVILCHGVFSWVPDDVKTAIFQHCAAGLKPNGIAAIAYVTYPGWKQREAFRELLQFQLRGESDPDQRIQRSALLLRLLQSVFSANSESPQALSLLALIESMQNSPKNAFLHDELGGVHDPCYFAQFVEWAREMGLDYVAESELHTMAMDGMPAEAHQALGRLSPNFIETQQILDFAVNRSGRTSILCRPGALGDRSLVQERIRDLELTTDFIAPARGDEAEGEVAQYWTLQGRKTFVESGLQRKILDQLFEAAPEPVPVVQLDLDCGENERDQAVSEMIGRGLVVPLGGSLDQLTRKSESVRS